MPNNMSGYRSSVAIRPVWQKSQDPQEVKRDRSLGNGVRKNGVRNRCPYRRCGVDTEIPYRLPFWREFCLFLPVRVAPEVDTEFPYRVRIVDRGVDCRDPFCRHHFRFPDVWPPFLQTGLFRPFLLFFCLVLPFPVGQTSTKESYKKLKTAFFLRCSFICWNPHLNPYLQHSKRRAE